jgi:hypothetical protein
MNENLGKSRKKFKNFKELNMNITKAVVAIFCLFAHFILNLEVMGTVLKHPELPKNLNNPAEVQNYLRKVHNYYVIIGRPRFESISSLDKYISIIY